MIRPYYDLNIFFLWYFFIEKKYFIYNTVHTIWFKKRQGHSPCLWRVEIPEAEKVFLPPRSYTAKKDDISTLLYTVDI
jgi:hypothetical protein